jgi:hypothetical protein
VGGSLSARTHCPRDARFEQRLRDISYAERSQPSNAFIQRIEANDAYQTALKATRTHLAELTARGVDIVYLAKAVVARLAHAWVGLPSSALDDTDTLVRFIEHFVVVSRCAFQPYPEPWLRARARHSGAQLMAAYAQCRPVPPMAKSLEENAETDSSRDYAQVGAIGAIVGFAPPAIGALISIFKQLLNSGELVRQRLLCKELDDEARRYKLRPVVVEALIAAPVPPILYRTCVEPFREAVPGNFVVVGLQSVAIDALNNGYAEPWQWLFGGAHGGALATGEPPHGCPASSAALESLVGVVAGVLDCVNIRRDLPMAFSFEAIGTIAQPTIPAKSKASKEPKAELPKRGNGMHRSTGSREQRANPSRDARAMPVLSQRSGKLQQRARPKKRAQRTGG